MTSFLKKETQLSKSSGLQGSKNFDDGRPSFAFSVEFHARTFRLKIYLVAGLAGSQGLYSSASRCTYISLLGNCMVFLSPYSKLVTLYESI